MSRFDDIEDALHPVPYKAEDWGPEQGILCAWEGCTRGIMDSRKMFVPSQSNQVYCCIQCNQSASTARRRAESNNQHETEALAEDMFKRNAFKFLDAHRPLDPVPERLYTTRLEEMGFDTPQSGVALFSDFHLGSVVDPRVTSGMGKYNPEIARLRLTRWRDLVLRFSQMQQVLMPVKELHLLALGDDFEGHGAMFATQALTLAEPLGFQYLSFVDYMSDVLLSYLSRYDHITVYKVHGNHGRIAARAKDAYPPDNIELMAWTNIADRLSKLTGGEWSEMSPAGNRAMLGGKIDFYIASSPAMFAEIEGWKFVMMHGHGMQGLQARYVGAIDTKLRYNSIVGETINYLVKAHLHEAQSAEHEIGGEIIQNACFVGPSGLSLSGARPAANLPSQELFFMHPKHGKTHHHRLHLATIDEMREDLEWIGRS